MIDKQEIIEDLKEMIHRLQKECTEKTDNILYLEKKYQQLKKEINEWQAKIIQIRDIGSKEMIKSNYYFQTLKNIKDICLAVDEDCDCKNSNLLYLIETKVKEVVNG